MGYWWTLTFRFVRLKINVLNIIENKMGVEDERDLKSLIGLVIGTMRNVLNQALDYVYLPLPISYWL